MHYTLPSLAWRTRGSSHAPIGRITVHSRVHGPAEALDALSLAAAFGADGQELEQLVQMIASAV
jgi:hypothetical protein